MVHLSLESAFCLTGFDTTICAAGLPLWSRIRNSLVSFQVERWRPPRARPRRRGLRSERRRGWTSAICQKLGRNMSVTKRCSSSPSPPPPHVHTCARAYVRTHAQTPPPLPAPLPPSPPNTSDPPPLPAPSPALRPPLERNLLTGRIKFKWVGLMGKWV